MSIERVTIWHNCPNCDEQLNLTFDPRKDFEGMCPECEEDFKLVH